MKLALSALCTACAALLLTGSKPVSLRLDVSAQPEGARVFVDGKLNGTAPCSVFGLLPGHRHLIHVEAPSCLPEDAFVRLDADNPFQQKNFSLAPMKGLVLVKTVPAGADVKYNGVSLGQTPLLVTSLVSDQTHALELTLNGYQRRRIDVKPEGRTPLVREEKLSLDSGVVDCTSEPAGATVTVNGVERGVTPLELTNIPKGLATISLKLAGYQDETRELRLVPGDRQTLAVKMKGRPGKLSVVSSPEQARVFIDNDYQGKTPMTVASIAPGEHEIRIELAGHAPVSRKVQIGNGEEKTEEFQMASVLGRLEIITVPPGAKISLDGKSVGTTRAAGDSTKSQILALEKIAAGEHAVLAHLDGCQDVSRKIVVEAKGTRQLFIRLNRIFTADTEIETINGAPVRGVLVERETDDTRVVLEITPGVQRAIPRDTIRKITSLKK